MSELQLQTVLFARSQPQHRMAPTTPFLLRSAAQLRKSNCIHCPARGAHIYITQLHARRV